MKSHTLTFTGLWKHASNDKVALLGSVVGLVTLWMQEFYIIRLNRLAAGEGMPLHQVAPQWVMGVTLALLVGLVLTNRVHPQGSRWLGAFTGAWMLLIPLYFSGLLASSVIQQGNPYARISLGPGCWLAMFAAFILLVNFHQGFKASASRWHWSLSAGVLLVVCLMMGSGLLHNLSLVVEFRNREERFYMQLLNHLYLSFGPVLISALIGIPLGILAWRKVGKADRQIFFALNIIQTIPSLALFGMLLAPLAWLSAKSDWLQSIGFQGTGWAPAVIALMLYSLLPIVRNTYTSFKALDGALLEAGMGMGMTPRQRLLKVEMPLAAPVLLNGLRIAMVQAVGNAAVAALIGAGGLGLFIFQGLGQAAVDLILLGAIPTILLAVVTDSIMQWLITIAQPKGMS